MKTITKEYKLYTYEELSKEAQEKVIENLRDINVKDDWYQFDFEEMIGDLAKMGFVDAELFFSGFYSPGDGACFTANLDIDKLVKYFKLQKKYAKLLKIYDIAGRISQSGNYTHSNTMDITLDFDFKTERKLDESLEALLDQLSENIDEEILELARIEADKIYEGLQKSYDYLTSEESIVETIKLNEYTFLKDGEMFNE